MKKQLSRLHRIIWAPIEIVIIIRHGNQMVDKSFIKKSNIRVFLDMLFWLVKYREVNKYYYSWGFYAKTRDQMHAYVPFKTGQRTVRYINSTRRDFNYIVLVRDKFVFGLILKALNIPTTHPIGVIRSQRLYLMSANHESTNIDRLLDLGNEMCCKPIDGQNGKDVFFIKTNPLKQECYIGDVVFNKISISSLFGDHSWIIEEKVDQHPNLEILNPGSLNTIRITTIHHSGVTKVISAIQRIGRRGFQIDNWDAGGLAVRIDLKTGRLDRFGFHKSGQSFDRSTASGVLFYNLEIPLFFEVIELVKKTHKHFSGLYTIGWDVAVSKSGPLIIEANNNWTFGFFQQLEGGARDLFENTFWKVAPQLKKI